jgi:hypothetical protein
MIILPSGHSNKLLCIFHFPIRAICPAHLILPHLIAIMILDEEHKLLSPSLRNVVHFAVTSSLLGPIFLSEFCF